MMYDVYKVPTNTPPTRYIKTHRITTSVVIQQRRNNSNSQYFNNYLFLTDIYIT
jgi:hypothetical protein